VPARAASSGVLLERIVPAYKGLLQWTLRHRVVTLAALLLLAASAYLPFSLIEKSGEPKIQQRAVSIFYEIKETMTKELMERNCRRGRGRRP
jgi:multidrug efflux pump subunit AcrB